MEPAADYLHGNIMPSLGDPSGHPCYGKIGARQAKKDQLHVVPDLLPFGDLTKICSPAQWGKGDAHEIMRLSYLRSRQLFCLAISSPLAADRLTEDWVIPSLVAISVSVSPSSCVAQ